MKTQNPSVSRGALRARAEDPSTPVAELVEIAHKFPAAVLRNPAFELATVADPGFLLAMPARSWIALLRQPDFPPEIILWTAQRLGDPRARQARLGFLIARHPNAPRAALELLEQTPDGPLSRLNAASRHAFARPWLAEVEACLRRFSSSNPGAGDLRVLAGLVRNGLVPGGDCLVRTLVSAAGAPLRARYAAHQRDLPEDVLVAMVDEEVRVFRRLVSDTISDRHARPDAGRELRRRRADFCGELQTSEDPAVLARSRRERDRARACMGLRGALPEESIRALAQDRAWRVRAAVAFRPQLGPVESIWLSKDPDDRVREALAASTSNPAVLEELARDRSIEVRMAVAGNRAAGPGVDALVSDAEAVREALLDAWRSGNRIDATGRPLCRRDASDAWPAEECAMLALRESYNSLARVLLLCSHRCPVQVLEDHLGSVSWWIRLAAVRNPRTPAQRVERVAETDWNWVVRAAAREALEARRTAAPLLPMPLDAAHVSERHMPASTRRCLTDARRQFRGETWYDIRCAVEIELADPHARRVLEAGMLRSSKSVRASGLSEVAKRVPEVHRARVVEMMAGGAAGEPRPDTDTLHVGIG